MSKANIEKVSLSIGMKLSGGEEIENLRLKLSQCNPLEVPGIKLLIPYLALNVGSDCISFAFGERPDAGQLFKELLNEGVPVNPPINGDYVCYFDSLGFCTHVGLIRDSFVVSKWGSRDVYEHTVELVPHVYGDRFLYLRPANR